MKNVRPLLLFSMMLVTVYGATSLRKVVFERNGAIWVADMDGKDAKKIATGDLPDISPDGTRIAFNTDESKNLPVRHIGIAEIDSGRLKILKSIPGDNSFGPAWSPDGKALLFSIYTDKDWQLGLINSDDSDFRIVKKAETKNASYYSPRWAPDGKSFFCHDLDAIYRFDLRGQLIKRWDLHSMIQDGDMNSNSRIAVSPDGKSLLIDLDMDEDSNRENWDGPPPAIWLIDLDSMKASRLTHKDFFAWDPYWIDNTEFVFSTQGPAEKSPSLYRGFIQGKNPCWSCKTRERQAFPANQNV